MSKNTIPKLLDVLRPNLPTVAEWVGRSIWIARGWQQDTYKPNAKDRARLVRAVRKHAKELLDLAATVEREGKARDGGN